MVGKPGMYFEYDLKANERVPKDFKCVACGELLRVRWTDYHGEGVCLRCELPYIILHYDENNKRLLDKGPEPAVAPQLLIDAVGRYYKEKHAGCGLGTYLGPPPSDIQQRYLDFVAWVKTQPEADKLIRREQT